MRILVFILSLSTSSVGFTASGFADTSTGDPGAARLPTPAFAMMDDTGDRSKFEIALGTTVIPSDPDARILAGRIAGQYVWPAGYGLYAAAMPAESGFGSIDIGALFHTAPSPNTSIGLRLGITRSLDPRDGIVSRLQNAKMRPADVILGLDASGFRLGVSTTYRGEAEFVRLDLGFDVAIERAIIGHGNLGAGIRRGGFSATAELQVAVAADSDEMEWLGAVGASARLHRDTISPFVMIAKPFGAFGLGGTRAGEFTVTAGVTFGL